MSLRRTLGAALLGVSGVVSAHPLAPGMLELTEITAGHYAVLWRTTVARAASGWVEPRLPCTPESAVDSRVQDGAQVSRWTASCPDLPGKTISVDQIEGSGINVIVRVAPLAGPEFKALLGADQPSAVVAFDDRGVFGRYFTLGAEHLLTGADHLLFLLGLFLLVPGLRMLVATVTAFTVGHSITLALAALGYVPLGQDFAELLIALTVLTLALALTLTRGPGEGGPLHRKPWLMAATFGLIHGLGFAGALRDIGLPASDIPLSLLAFNLGIEATQLAVIAMLLLAAFALRRLPALPKLAPLVPSYLIGSMAACWVLERSAALLA